MKEFFKILLIFYITFGTSVKCNLSRCDDDETVGFHKLGVHRKSHIFEEKKTLPPYLSSRLLPISIMQFYFQIRQMCMAINIRKYFICQ